MVDLNAIVALNDEIASYTRKQGYPVLGLAEDVAAVPDRLGRINVSITRRMVRGETLAAALLATQNEMPRAYFAMMQVGLACGDMLHAWRAWQDREKPFVELRRFLTRSLIYPAIVVVTAAVLLLVTPLFLDPVLATTAEIQELPAVHQVTGLSPVRVSGLLFFTLIAALAWAGRHGIRNGSLRRWGRGGWQSARHDSERALVASITADLVARELAPRESLVLAAALVEDPTVQKELAANGSIMDAGANGSFHESPTPTVSLLNFLAAHGEQYPDIVDVWRLAAQVYDSRCHCRLDRIKRWAPIVVGLLIGGTATLLYSLSLFLPLTQLLQQLARS